MRLNFNYYTKLFLIVLSIVIIASGLVSGISVVQNMNSIHAVTEQMITSNAEQKESIFKVNISRLHALSNTIGNNLEIEQYFINRKAGKEDDAFYRIIKKDLEEEMKSYPSVLENIFFVYDGICIVDGLGGKSVGYDIEGEASEWYTNVMHNKKHYLGKLRKSPITGLPVMVSAYPVLDEKQEVIAVLGLAINLNGFSNTILYNPVNTKENTMIIDESGTVIAANAIALIYNYNVERELPELQHFIETKGEGITYFRKDGIEYMAALKKTDSEVSIIQSIPVSVYRNPIIKSIVISVIVLLGILCVVAIITFFAAKNITKPIRLLVNEFNDMAAGNYIKEVSDYLQKRKDEFGLLGKELAVMKKQTGQLIESLNLSNEEAEASLEEVLATEEELRKQNVLLRISEENLEKSYEYNKAIIDVIPDIIFIMNADGVFTGYQAKEGNIFYYKQGIIGKRLEDIMPEDIAALGIQKIRDAIRTGILQRFEYEMDLEESKIIYEFRIIKLNEDGAVAIARDITQQFLYQKKIENLSYYDQLTGLYNRRFFEEEMKRMDQEVNLPLCIIMADVNGLKLVNDSFGHKVGDLLLTNCASALKESCLLTEEIFRIGGDEFVILAPCLEKEQAEEFVASIKRNCGEKKINGINLSVSFGWDIKKHVSEDINMVFKNAEDFMYKKKLFEGPRMRSSTLSLIMKTLHEKDDREEEHSRRVAELCERFANSMQMTEHEIKEIKNAGFLHDIGKAAIQESLLNKPGELTAEEFEEIKRHSEIGYHILRGAGEMSEVAEYVLLHHERWDGKGYPKGLAGEEIPLQARILAIVDSFDAMTSTRSFREALPEEAAVKEILENAGTQFDPYLAHKFVEDVLGYGNI